MDALFICQKELNVKTNISPSYFSYQSFISRLFLTYSQVELILFCKGFRHKAWMQLISWVRFSPRKSLRRIQPLTFGFQTTMKNKDIFSQDTAINTAPSCFGILEEMNLQVWFYESSSFSQLFACCYVLSGMNACVNQRGQYSCQCFRYNSQNSRFLILPLSEKSHKTKPAKASPSPVQSAAETFPYFLLFSFVTLYLGVSLDQSLSHWKSQSIIHG